MSLFRPPRTFIPSVAESRVLTTPAHVSEHAMPEEVRIKVPAWMNREPPQASSMGILFMMKERLSNLNLEGRVFKEKNKSTGGAYGDVFIGSYFPTVGPARLVAVKELRVHILKEKDVQRRLARELYIWSKLNHPNILPFCGFYIENNNYLHLVSPWMQNETIMSYLESNPMADVVSLVQGIAEGVCYLHAKNIIHSDIKPHNVLISDFGKPQLCDFGVSRILESSVSFQTSTLNNARGTLRYMAKEVILSEDGKTWCKEADVWAFGMTVYSIITKRQPYHHILVDAAVIFEICNGKLPSWPEESESWPLASRGLQDICAQCWLGKSERPSIEDVISRLDTLSKKCHVTACLECLSTMTSQLKFNICDIGSSYLMSSEVPGLESCIEDNVSNAFWNACLNWSSELQPDDALRGPIAEFFSSLRPLYWIEVLSLLGGLETGYSILQNCIEKFQGEDQIVLLAKEWQAFISDFYDAISISAPHIYISALSWGVPNPIKCFHERSLLVSEDHETLKSPAYKRASELSLTLLGAWCLSISPDGRNFASGHEDGSLRVWNAAGELIWNVKAHKNVIIDVKFSRDAGRIVTGSLDGTLKIWDARTGDRMVGPLKGHVGLVCAVTCSPDGMRIASGSWDKTLRIWDARTGKTIGKPLIGNESPVSVVSYSPDSNMIVSASDDGTLRIWDARRCEQIGEPLRGHSGAVHCVVYSTDGSRIVSGSDDETVRIWDARTTRQIGEPLIGHKHKVRGVAYTSDGSRIASRSLDNTMCIWDARTGHLLGVIPQGESRWDSDNGHFLSIPCWWPISGRLHSRTLPIIEPLVHSDAPARISDDGWLRTLDDGLFLWVPLKHREDVCRRGPTGGIPPRLKFDWKSVPHGNDWTKVKEMIEGSNEVMKE